MPELISLKFRSYAGLEDVFNTLRLGSRWGKRVQEGDRVTLLDEFNQVFGSAEVLSVYTGEKDAIIQEHARFNHNIAEQMLPESQASEIMVKRLRRVYGSGYFKKAKTMTAIYLRRI